MTEVTFPQMSREKPDAVGLLATWYAATGEQVAAVESVTAGVPVILGAGWRATARPIDSCRPRCSIVGQKARKFIQSREARS
mgnify:CR=1 FL=1